MLTILPTSKSYLKTKNRFFKNQKLHQKAKIESRNQNFDPKSSSKNPKTLQSKNRVPKDQNSNFGSLKNDVPKGPTKKDQKCSF